MDTVKGIPEQVKPELERIVMQCRRQQRASDFIQLKT